MKRKRRYRKRKYRSKRRRRNYRASIKPEVKVWDTANVGKGIQIDIDADGTLRALNIIFSNIFSLITLGTSQYQRVGNRIFVKTVQIRCTYWTCGFTYSYSGSSRNIAVNTALMRVIVSNTIGGAIDQVNFFAGTNGGSKISCPLNRKVYNIRADKTFRLQGGLASIPGDPATTTQNSTGDVRTFNMNVPVNKVITYKQNDIGASTEVKDSQDSFSIAAISSLPNVATFTGTPRVTPVCTNWHLRVYYTDS